MGYECTTYAQNAWCCPIAMPGCNADYAVGGIDSDQACCGSCHPTAPPPPAPVRPPPPPPVRPPPPPPPPPIGPCDRRPCGLHGVCSTTGTGLSPSDYSCACEAGYGGPDCHDSALTPWGVAPLAVSRDACTTDQPGWVDSSGDTCATYVSSSWCCPPALPDCNADYAVNGLDSDRACCASCLVGADNIGKHSIPGLTPQFVVPASVTNKMHA